MTREEAISDWTFRSNHIKKWLDEHGEEPSIRHYVELIDMAIEALSAVCDDCIWNVCNYNKVDWDGEDGYISKRDAINAIENTDAEITAGEWDELTNAIKSLPSAEAAQGWIPVSERLPSGNENVLADDGVDMFVAWYTNGWLSTDHAYDPYTDIIAWMPLPEPYKGGDDE